MHMCAGNMMNTWSFLGKGRLHLMVLWAYSWSYALESLLVVGREAYKDAGE